MYITNATVKHKVGHKLSQFTHRFKIGIFDVVLVLWFQVFRTHKEILESLDVGFNGFLNFS